MSTENIDNPMKNYKVYGELLIPHDMIITGDGTISIKNYGSSMFYDWAEYVRTQNFPELINEISAFHIREVSQSTGRVINGFDAIITRMLKYNVDPSKNEVTLEFKYRKAGTGSTDIPTIKPIISHMIVDDGFIALVIEGEWEAVEKFMESISCFRHNDKIYYMQRKSMLKYVDQADVDKGRKEPMKLAGVYIGSEKKVAPEEDLVFFNGKFLRILCKYLGGNYV